MKYKCAECGKEFERKNKKKPLSNVFCCPAHSVKYNRKHSKYVAKWGNSFQMPFKPDVNKIIMPNRCDLCSIGIGTSMVCEKGVWSTYRHIEKKINNFYWKEGKIRVCDECLDDLNKKKNSDKYLSKLFSKRVIRGGRLIDVQFYLLNVIIPI